MNREALTTTRLAAVELLANIGAARGHLAEHGRRSDPRSLMKLTNTALDLAEKAVSEHLKTLVQLERAAETVEAAEQARRAGPPN